MSTKTLLIVEDEAPIRDMIVMVLTNAGYRCLEAESVQQAYQSTLSHKPDLILLDWMLKGGSGIDLANRLKSQELTFSIPIIMLSARGEEHNKVKGLETGADDYITKPFSPKELIARIQAVLRRGPQKQTETLCVQGLEFDPISHRVLVDQTPINLGPTEYRLLHFFLTHPERVYSREQLLDHVWGTNVYVEERTIDVHIRRLRKALGDPYSQLIQTVRGSGYRFSTRN